MTNSYYDLSENVKNINDTFEVTMGSKEVNDVLRRIMKCKEILWQVVVAYHLKKNLEN